MKKSMIVFGTLMFLLAACEQAPAPVEPKASEPVVVVPTEPKVAGSQPAGAEAAKPKVVVRIKQASKRTIERLDLQIAKLKERIVKLETAKQAVATGTPVPERGPLQSP